MMKNAFLDAVDLAAEREATAKRFFQFNDLITPKPSMLNPRRVKVQGDCVELELLDAKEFRQVCRS